LRKNNFEIVSVAQDTGGVKAAGPWVEKAKAEYTVLIDTKHEVTRLFDMVNVPTAVWVDEKGRIARPNEVAYADNRLKALHGQDAGPYLKGLRDWVADGDRSPFVLTDAEWKERLKPQTAEHGLAAAEFVLAEHLHRAGHAADAIPHYKEAQRLNPDNWNYKRQAWALGNADRDYGTNFLKEVQKLNGKPYYAPRLLPDPKEKKN
jgi:hypothetical protein